MNLHVFMFLFHLHLHHQRSTVVVSIHAARNSSFLHHVAQEASVLGMRVLAFRVSAQLPPLMTKDSQGLEIGCKKSSSLVGALTKKGRSMMNNGVRGFTKITKSFSYGGNSPNWTSEIVPFTFFHYIALGCSVHPKRIKMPLHVSSFRRPLHL